MAGQVAGQLKEIKSVREIFEQLDSEYREVVKKLSQEQ